MSHLAVCLRNAIFVAAILGFLPLSAVAQNELWFDVTQPLGNCAGALPSSNSTGAIQCHINYLFSRYGGAVLYFPPGDYRVESTITLRGGVTLKGSGIHATTISTTGNFTAIALNTSVSEGGFRDMWVLCDQSSAARQSCVTIATNVAAILCDDWIWGGDFALQNKGVDGIYENLYLTGWGADGGAIYSSGANWYIRDKIDTSQTSVVFAFVQGPSERRGVVENHFTQCDFSGNYLYSIFIDDGGTNTAITDFSDSVFSSPIMIVHSKFTFLNGDEIGSPNFALANGVMTITGSIAFQDTRIAGAGTRSCSGNYLLSC